VGQNASTNTFQEGAVAISADGNTAIIGGSRDNFANGGVWIYVKENDNWVQQGNKLIGTGPIGYTLLGCSVSLSADGNTAIVGGYLDDNGKGAVWIFSRNNGVWTQQGNKLVGSGAIGNASQGFSVSLSADGNTAIVGGFSDNNNTGAAWIFSRNNGVWLQEGSKLVGSGTVGIASQGWSVSISADGNTAIVGGLADNTRMGASWIFVRNGGLWTQQGNKLVGTGNSGSEIIQGESVALSADGNTAIVSGKGDNGYNGAVWIFKRNGTVWSQDGLKLSPNDNIGLAFFGTRVSISGDANTVFVGGPGDNNSQGAIWAFSRTSGIWSQQGNKFITTGINNGTQIGSSVAISTDGNSFIAEGGQAGGNLIWIYKKVLNIPLPTINSITPNNGSIGSLVKIIGADLDNQTSVNIGGTQAIVLSNSGSELVAMVMPGATTGIISITTAGGTISSANNFTVTTTGFPNHQQGNKLVGTNGIGASNQGNALAVSADGNTAIIGGMQDNNNQGAAWIFTRSNSGVWSQQGSKLVGTGGSINSKQGISVAINADGNTAAIGGYNDNTNMGAVWIFTRDNTGTWSQQGTKLVDNTSTNANQGNAISLSADGNTILVGGFNDNSGMGAAWIYTRTGTNWNAQSTKLVGTNNLNAQLGWSVSLSSDGKSAIVGGYSDLAGNGAAWIFRKNVNDVWSQEGDKLFGTGSIGHAQQGASVAINANGTTAIVGGWGDNNVIGAAWIFTRNNSGVWLQEGNKIVGSGLIGQAYFGNSVSMSADGNAVAIGGWEDNSFNGATWVFGRNNGVWSQQGNKLVANDNAGVAAQGYAVAMSADGSTLLVGGKGDNSGIGATWSYNILPAPAPSISSFSPSSGSIGSLITISGANLNSPTSLNIGGVQAIIISNTGTQLVAMLMPGSTTGIIAITTAGGAISSGNSFTVTPTIFSGIQQGAKKIGNDIQGTSNINQGSSVAISADGNTAIVGAFGDNNVKGAALIYTRLNGIWSQQGTKLVGTGSGIFNSLQGYAVAISADGNTVLIGGQGESGIVTGYVFARSGNSWTQQGDRIVGTGNTGMAYYSSSSAVALSADGNTAIIGGGADNSNHGAIWVFNRSAGVWSQQGNKITVNDAVGAANFGSTVAISADGNTFISGGSQDNGQIGAAWIFTKSGNTWVQQGAKLVGTGNVGNSFQGFSVALNADGNIAMIGGMYDNSFNGAAWIFTRSAGVWSQQGSKITANESNHASQGWSVALSADGNIVLMGEPAGVGDYWVFARTGNNWLQQGTKITGTGSIGSSYIGSSLAISSDGTTAIVGGYQDNSQIGAAWIFGSAPVVVATPSISSFSPSNVNVGSLITITGTNLNNPNTLNIGGVPAIIISNNGTQIIAMVMPGATTGNIAITTASGTTTSATNVTIVASGIPNTQQGTKLVGTGNINNANHGYAVALSADGNTAAISGLNDNSNVGAVWIYVRSGNTWMQQADKLVGTGATGNANQGVSLALSKDGNTLLVGGFNDNVMVGAAWVFTRTGNTWTQQGNKLIGSGGDNQSSQGTSVALSADGNTAMIGGYNDNGGVGAAWIFTRTANTWTQQGNKLVGSGSVLNASQGIAVSLSADGNTAMMGGYLDNDRIGACWVFTRTANIWLQQGSKIVPNDLSGKPYFGGSVSLSADGNTAVVGGTGDNNNEGALWVFVRSGNAWTQQGTKLIGTGNVGAASQGFKVSISADGNRIIEGSMADDNYQGAVWLFTRTGNTWTQEGNKLFGTGGVGASHQGVSVAISADGNTACVGGNADNNWQGAAWIFVPGSGSGSGGGGAVSGGGSGGLESKSLGDAVVKRVYAKAKADLNGPDDYSKMPLISHNNNNKQITGIGNGSSIKLSGIMPDISARGYVAYNSTPLDITAITNAKEVLSTDFTANNQCKAVAFATKTQGELYDHTKPICDRLKGASLVNVENMNLGGFDFVKYTLNNDKGQLEYATSFSVGMKAGRNDFTIQSTWLLKDYISDETLFNFQLWAATPELVKTMVNDVLSKLQTIAPIKSITKSSIPATYILAGKREAQNLNLIVTNSTANTSGYFILEDKSNETNLGITSRKIPFTIQANAVSNVSIPMSDLYESTVTMYMNAEMKDVVYMSDGTWYADYNRSTTTLNSFTISNDANRTITTDEFPLMRNVAVSANSKDYVSIVKLLKGGAAETDLTSYKGLKITASGGNNLHITLVKNSTANWKDQYYTDIKLNQAQTDYFVSLDKFISSATNEKIKANDITTVVFSVEVASNGNSSTINTTLSNVSFTKVDIAYNNSLESKEVNVYPNPAKGGNFMCSFLSDKATELTLRVRDVTGRELLTKQISAMKGQNSVQVNVPNSINGGHVLSLEGMGIKYTSKKLLIVY
jgi:hypothetical protein